MASKSQIEQWIEALKTAEDMRQIANAMPTPATIAAAHYAKLEAIKARRRALTGRGRRGRYRAR